MKHKFLSSLLVIPLLCSCSPEPPHYGILDYSKTLSWKDGFNVCLLSDTHFSTMTNLPLTFNYLDKIIYSYSESGNVAPDLIILNGDTFMNADRNIVTKVFEYLNDLNIPFALTNGNHDYQGMYTSNYIASQMKKYSNCMNVIVDDMIRGRTNSVINLKDGDKLKFQIYLLDSNTYVNGKYDVIHDDQINWYKNMILESNGYTSLPSVIDEDTFVKSLMFFHIPIPEYIDAYNEFKSHEDYEEGKTLIEDNYVDIRESISAGYKKNDLLKVIDQLKSTVGIACSHDHTNSMDYFYSYEDSTFETRLMYGNKSTSEIYHDPNLLGATFIKLKETPTMSVYGNKFYFDMTQIHMTYSGERSVLK